MYDQVSGMLIALLMVLGIFVALLFLIWVTSQVWVREVAVPVTILEEEPEPGGGGSGVAQMEGEMLDEPPADEVVEAIEPQVESTLESISDVVSTQALALDKITPIASGQGRGQG